MNEHHVSAERVRARVNVKASGILLIACSTCRIALAWRSRWVQQGNCWGTIGGAACPDLSLADNARRELAEETGYPGPIVLYPSFVYAAPGFEYHNFIGVVPSEFELAPALEHRWETDALQWFDRPLLLEMMRARPTDFHLGVRKLFEEAHTQILELADPGNRMRPWPHTATVAPSMSTGQ